MARRKTFYMPKAVVRQASRPGLKKEQITAIMTYLKDRNISPSQPKQVEKKKRELSPAQEKALAAGRRALAKKQVRKFFGREGEVEYGTGSGVAGQLVKTAYEKKRAPSPRTMAREVLRDYAREQEYKENLRKIKLIEAKKKYYATRIGGFSKGAQRTLGFVKSPMASLIKYSYGSQMSGGSGGRTSFARRGVGRGRPRGTFDTRYAAYGGVYGYRKAMAHKRAMEKLQAQHQANLTPEQVMAIRAVRARQANPETKTFPDTTGYVDTSGYMNEIDNAAGAGDKAAWGMLD